MIQIDSSFSDEPSPPPVAGEDPIAAIFREGGWLETCLGLEHRPQQEAMALAVQRSILGQSPHFFEAGTGVGKSLAYLIPGIILGMTMGRPLVVSSHTIALQHQILEKDLEICRQLFQAVPSLQRFASFKRALLVGRGNYICIKRLSLAHREREDLFTLAGHSDLQRLIEWSQSSTDGLRQELDGPVPAEIWDAVNADSSSCNQKDCPAKECFFHRARKRVQEADVVILNHSLLFSLINAGMAPGGETPGVLFPKDMVVIDEAHTVPAIATRHFGFSLSSLGVERLMNSLFHVRRQKGFLLRAGNRRHHEAVMAVQEAAAEFFGAIDATILGKRSVVRLHRPDWTAPTLLAPLEELVGLLGELSGQLSNENQLNELKDYRTRATKMLGGVRRFLELDYEGHVHWVERTGRRRSIIHLQTAPIDVAPDLREVLFRRDSSVTLTSATLSTRDNSVDYFARQCGGEDCPAQVVTSPFDYRRRVRVLVAEDAPVFQASRSTATPAYIDYWIDAIDFFVGQVAGGTLVLFTSYADLLHTARLAEARLQAQGRELLYQSEGSNRSALLQRFREQGNGILFGTESFWTGVDVPGPALEQVIITKLPFENPSHPIAEARVEALRARGLDPFREWTLPEAMIRLRQGFGRLIRTATDSGLVTLLDSRMVRKQYGRAFLEALPPAPVERFNRENRHRLFGG